MQVDGGLRDKTDMKFPEKLAALMERSPYSQDRVARACGVSQPKVSRWLKGTGKPDLAQGLALARFFGVELAYLADDALDAEPESRELPEDERQLVTLYRALKGGGMSAAEALLRLSTAMEIRPVNGGPARIRPVPRDAKNHSNSG